MARWACLTLAAASALGVPASAGSHWIDAALAALQAGPTLDDIRAAPTYGQGVTVAPQFSAALVYNGELVGMAFKDGRGTFLYDRIGQRNRMTFTVVNSYFHPNETVSQDQLSKNVSGSVTNMTWGVGANGVCTPFTGLSRMGYSDTFAWLKAATKNGSKVVEGVSCDLYSLGMPGFIFQACVSADGVPREVNQTFGGPGSKFSGMFRLQLSNPVLGDPGDVAFAPTEACADNYPVPPCDDDGVETLQMYRIWAPPEPLELRERNTGDVMGDLAFVCTQGSSEAYRAKLLTYWTVTVSRAFGQYAMCNFNGTANLCAGTHEQLTRVGRRSGQMAGLGPLMGQCSPNEDLGSQYSFPTAAMCAPGVAPSSKGCAWAEAKPARTIKADCVMEERGLLAACAKEVGHAPFEEASRIWVAAFASSDPSLGGCPDAPPHATQGISVIL